MSAILNAIEKREIMNVDKIVVISNRVDSIGLQIAKNRLNVSTEIILNKNVTKEEFDKRLICTLKSYEVYPNNGLICLAGFMQILGPFIVNMYKKSYFKYTSLFASFV